MSNYKLEVFSKKNRNKAFQPHFLKEDRQENPLRTTIGVDEGEEFGIRFVNNSWDLVQVRLSVDGTDILSGEPANLNSSGRMWVVKPNQTMEIEAWPETDKDGRRFVFGDKETGVAVNTHGDVRGVGLIAAAVFVEGRRSINRRLIGDVYNKFRRVSGNEKYRDAFDDTTLSDSDVALSDTVKCSSARCRAMNVKSLAVDSEPAVGAGETISQAIHKTAGLVEPKLDNVIEVKYEWWNVLQTKLGLQEPRKTAFPGEKPKVINKELENVPRAPVNRSRHKPFGGLRYKHG